MNMITENKLLEITHFLQDEVFRNVDVMYYTSENLTDIIATLHNLLWECVYGEPYNYMYHWANKIGTCTNDNYNNWVKDDK